MPNATPLDVATLGGGIGQLGSPVNAGSALPNTVPIDVAGFGGAATAMAAYSNHSCAVSTTGPKPSLSSYPSGKEPAGLLPPTAVVPNSAT